MMLWRRLLVPAVLFAALAGLSLLFLGKDHVSAKLSSEQVSVETMDVPVVTAAIPPFEVPAVHNMVTFSCATDSAASHDSEIWVIGVSVATLWKEPAQARTVDSASLQNPTDLRAWLHPLSIADKLWFVGKLETEALLGTSVKLLSEQGDWAKVAVLDQSTSRLAEGYPGWLPKSQLTEPAHSYEACPSAEVRKPTARLFSSADTDEPSEEISFNTRLPILGNQHGRLAVGVPQGVRWIPSEDVQMMDEIDSSLTVTGDQIVETAKQFLQLPYLWAGTSGFGFDCSGFTYSLYRQYGISIPRDAEDQYKAGIPVKQTELQPGDLLFYAYNHGKGKVHHVAMYIGQGQMIHSPKTERSVEIIPISTKVYAAEFAGARRMLK